MPATEQPTDTQDIISLLRTALYDQAGEMVEGGFVDYWVSNASVALDNLAERFTSQGLPAAALDWLLTEIRLGAASSESARSVLHFLGRSFPSVRGLVRTMLQEPLPHVRAIAVWVEAEMVDPSAIEPLYTDASPVVRAAVVGSLREAQPLFLRALYDIDPVVRTVAVQKVRFKDNPTGGEALAAQYWAETDTDVRTALLKVIADTAHSAATSRGLPDAPCMRQRIGEPLVRVLLHGLTHDDRAVRIRVADGARYLHGADVSHALLEQLRVESDVEVRRALVRWPNRNFTHEAVPLFASLLAHDPDISLRIAIADQMASLGPDAAPALIAALDDPSSDIREAAARALQGAGRLYDLPDLLHHFVLAAAPPLSLYDAITQAIQMIVYRAALNPSPPPPNSSAVVQSLIDALDPDPVSQWHIRFCKETLNALPLYTSRALYLWALHPNGDIVQIDLDSASLRIEPETDALTRFTVMLHAARQYPNLRPLIPVPPLQADPLRYLLPDGNEP